MKGLLELLDGHHILGVAFHVANGSIPASMKIPKQHHTHKRPPPTQPRSLKNLERYQALLTSWFREEPTLDYDNLTNEEAEAALQALMEATIEVGYNTQPGAENYGARTKTDGSQPYWRCRPTYNLLKSFEAIWATLPRDTAGFDDKCLDEIYKRSRAREKNVERALKRDEDPH